MRRFVVGQLGIYRGREILCSTLTIPLTRRDIEEATLRAFVRRERGDRYTALLKSRKRRGKLLSELHHFYDFDGRCIIHLERAEDSPRTLYNLLRKLGAPETCYVISAGRLDGEELDLAEAVTELHATGMGAIVSCVPGRLAYYEGEDDRFILYRN